MCGVAGIFSKEKINFLPLLYPLEATKHRGPDDTHIAALINNKPEIFSCKLSSEASKNNFKQIDNSVLSQQWFGFNRLSIIDLSSHGMQPFYDAASNCSFMMNGEIFNYKEIKKTFLKDEKFFSSSDSEVAFKLYIKLGDDFVQHLRGMFAIVIIHHKKNKIKVWRDRFGIKPFFYSITNNVFIFSSEINGIFSTRLLEKEINHQNLANEFYLGTSNSPHTIYKNVFSLQPASVLYFDAKTFQYEVKKYWQLHYYPSSGLITENKFLSDLQEIANLSLASDSQVKKGLMLSGGLDSGTLAYLFKNKTQNLTAYTINNEHNEHLNELYFARLNAENAILNLQSFEIPNHVSSEIIKEFCVAEEEPNTAPEPAYYLSKELNNKVKILYNALGFDELFYGYYYYVQAIQLQLLNKKFYSTASVFLSENKKKKLKELAQFGIEAIPFVSRSCATWNDVKKLFSAFGSNNWNHPLEEIFGEIKKSFPGFYTMPLLKKISFLDFHYYISSHHSFRSERPSMLHHIEMRFPFLDHIFIQKYFNMQGLGKGLTKKKNKPFLRKNVRNILNPENFSMPKKGFSMPVKSWIDSAKWNEYKDEINFFSQKEIENFATSAERKWLLISLNEICKKDKLTIQ